MIDHEWTSAERIVAAKPCVKWTTWPRTRNTWQTPCRRIVAACRHEVSDQATSADDSIEILREQRVVDVEHPRGLDPALAAAA
ncbi:MAG TPA: hypothetical protein PLR28_05600, partial [Dokdonella sp.]|nr:hypothetical protein [Dokdonella sp.]